MNFIFQDNYWLQVLALILLVIMNFFVWRRFWREARKLYHNITVRYVSARFLHKDLPSDKQLSSSWLRYIPRRGRLD
ncbi:MAG: hypothetical protein A4E52_00600 [Pelotomaculum sp. PtaB.Bin013]|nr:MAG: hypothetical protein A4E52_00600 [Pelotomaculum sp. PtaB.Bin013]